MLGHNLVLTEDKKELTINFRMSLLLSVSVCAERSVESKRFLGVQDCRDLTGSQTQKKINFLREMKQELSAAIHQTVPSYKTKPQLHKFLKVAKLLNNMWDFAFYI